MKNTIVEYGGCATTIKATRQIHWTFTFYSLDVSDGKNWRNSTTTLVRGKIQGNFIIAFFLYSI